MTDELRDMIAVLNRIAEALEVMVEDGIQVWGGEEQHEN